MAALIEVAGQQGRLVQEEHAIVRRELHQPRAQSIPGGGDVGGEAPGDLAGRGEPGVQPTNLLPVLSPLVDQGLERGEELRVQVHRSQPAGVGRRHRLSRPRHVHPTHGERQEPSSFQCRAQLGLHDGGGVDSGRAHPLVPGHRGTGGCHESGQFRRARSETPSGRVVLEGETRLLERLLHHDVGQIPPQGKRRKASPHPGQHVLHGDAMISSHPGSRLGDSDCSCQVEVSRVELDPRGGRGVLGHRGGQVREAGVRQGRQPLGRRDGTQFPDHHPTPGQWVPRDQVVRPLSQSDRVVREFRGAGFLHATQ